jgi:hypothetical protein
LPAVERNGTGQPPQTQETIDSNPKNETVASDLAKLGVKTKAILDITTLILGAKAGVVHFYRLTD